MNGWNRTVSGWVDAANKYKPAATAEVAISRHIPLVSAGAENAIGFVESTFLKANIYFHIKK